MKKTIVWLTAFIVFAGSCKHEPLVDSPPTGGTGGSGTGGQGSGSSGSVTCSPDTSYFQQQVLPIFVSNCALSGCHDASTRIDGVDLSNYNGIMQTGDVRPGRPGDSEIWEKINESDVSERMPPLPRNPLSQEQKNTIYKWIMQGARNNSCQPTSCDTLNVTYTTSIRSIISTKCQGCHSSSAPSGGIDLGTYAGVKAKINDGRLWGAVNHQAGFSPMPKGGVKLSDCELSQIKKWMDSGAPNN